MSRSVEPSMNLESSCIVPSGIINKWLCEALDLLVERHELLTSSQQRSADSYHTVEFEKHGIRRTIGGDNESRKKCTPEQFGTGLFD